MNPSDFWFPWYPALYAEHAVALNLEQDAIYRRMIDRYMLRREPLPSSGQAVANICMISLEKWQEHCSIVLAFFEEKGGYLHHKKCDIELDRQDAYSKRMSENSKKAKIKRNLNQSVTSGGSAGAAIQDKDRIRIVDSLSIDNESPPLPPAEAGGILKPQKRRNKNGKQSWTDAARTEIKRQESIFSQRMDRNSESEISDEAGASVHDPADIRKIAE